LSVFGETPEREHAVARCYLRERVGRGLVELRLARRVLENSGRVGDGDDDNCARVRLHVYLFGGGVNRDHVAEDVVGGLYGGRGRAREGRRQGREREERRGQNGTDFLHRMRPQTSVS